MWSPGFSPGFLNVAILMSLYAQVARAEGKRVALVIGNGAYKHAGELRNPRNDARDVADSLEKLGFAVIFGVDLEQAEMRRTIGRFAQRSKAPQSVMRIFGSDICGPKGRRETCD